MSQKRVTLKDIAEVTGYSKGSVARVLLGSGKGSVRVGQEATKKIKAVAAKMNYQPNVAARQLAGKGSKLIGVIIDSDVSLSQHEVLSCLEKEISAIGYRILVGQSHNEPDKMLQYFNDFKNRGIECIVSFSHNYPGYSEILGENLARFKKTVFLGRPMINKSVYCVESDFEHGVYHAVKHLIERGRKRIALFELGTGTNAFASRFYGYKRALEELGGGFEPELVYTFPSHEDLSDENIAAAVDTLYKEQEIDAIVAWDTAAAAALSHMWDAGIKCPEDVAVVGFDNYFWTKYLKPSLTSIDTKPKELAKKMAELVKLILNSDSYTSVECLVEPELVVRKST
ncbi:MAG: LacI family DNA-binding transcriptional regulator [Sedimentisphaeraceae bacterium JB056]